MLTSHFTVVFDHTFCPCPLLIKHDSREEASGVVHIPKCNVRLRIPADAPTAGTSGQRTHSAKLVGFFLNYWDTQTGNVYLCLNHKMCFAPTHSAVCFLESKCCHENCKAVCLVPRVAFLERGLDSVGGVWWLPLADKEQRRMLPHDYMYIIKCQLLQACHGRGGGAVAPRQCSTPGSCEIVPCAVGISPSQKAGLRAVIRIGQQVLTQSALI